MKLLFCPNCADIFNLTTRELRTCECGRVKGKYNEDRHTAVTNGEGLCLGINNNELRRSMYTYSGIDDPESVDYEMCRKDMNVEVWVRPHSGPGNPRSTVDPDL